MDDVISLEEAQDSESAYVWTNSSNLQFEWDPEAYYFDALSNRHYGKFINGQMKETTVKSNGARFFVVRRYGRRWQSHYTKSLDWPTMTHTGIEFIMDYAR